jgi:hypothetical protein
VGNGSMKAQTGEPFEIGAVSGPGGLADDKVANSVGVDGPVFGGIAQSFDDGVDGVSGRR